MMLKLNYRIAVFPSWYIYNVIKNSRKESGKLRFSDYYFIAWATCQWFLIFFSGKNILFNLISAHLSILGFLLGNIYLQLDTSKYSLHDQKFLKSIPLKVLVAIGTVSFMYFFGNLPSMTLKGVEEYLGVEIVSGSFIWTFYHSIIGYVLLFSWFIFVMVNQYKIFDLFPRSDETMWPYKLGKLGKMGIFLFYITIILIFNELLIERHLVYFGK